MNTKLNICASSYTVENYGHELISFPGGIFIDKNILCFVDEIIALGLN